MSDPSVALDKQGSRTWRLRLAQFIGHARVQQAIVTLIVINAITLGLETSQSAMQAAGGLLIALDRTILTISSSPRS